MGSLRIPANDQRSTKETHDAGIRCIKITLNLHDMTGSPENTFLFACYNSESEDSRVTHNAGFIDLTSTGAGSFTPTRQVTPIKKPVSIVGQAFRTLGDEQQVIVANSSNDPVTVEISFFDQEPRRSWWSEPFITAVNGAFRNTAVLIPQYATHYRLIISEPQTGSSYRPLVQQIGVATSVMRQDLTTDNERRPLHPAAVYLIIDSTTLGSTQQGLIEWEIYA